MQNGLGSWSTVRRTVGIGIAAAIGITVVTLVGCGFDFYKEYPISSDVATTRERTIVPDALPYGVQTLYPYQLSEYAANGYGTWHYEEGTDGGIRTDLMDDDYSASDMTNTAKLLHFFTISDIHITDEETPNQAIFMGYKGGTSSAYSGVIMLTTQVLDATVQTINAIHKNHPFDLGISLGDNCNNSQYNELRWFIDILDGKDITPDSGKRNDPVFGPYNDYQDTFKATGLNPEIPWYQVLGNHDHWWMGSYPVTDYFREVYTGRDILLLGNFYIQPIEERTDYMGSIDGSTPYGDIIGVGPVENFVTAPQIEAADENRYSLTKKQWMNEFFNTTSTPAGHGFSQANIDANNACYSFMPKSGLPIKVIVLDNTQPDEGTPNYHGHGYIDEERFNWLVSELDAGQAANQLMIIAAHIPVEYIGLALNGVPFSPVSAETILKKLSAYPNLILWIAGHCHRNIVTPWPSSDPDYIGAQYGFWEVETASLRDFPQTFRTFEIVRNSDNTLSIFITNVDNAAEEGSLADLSRFYAVGAEQLFGNVVNFLPSGVYNAELVKELSPTMQTEIQKYGTPIPW